MNIAISCLNINLNGLGGLQNRLRYLIKGLLDSGIKVNLIQTKSAFGTSQEFFNSLDRKHNLSSILIPDIWNLKMPWSFLKLHAFRIQNKLTNQSFDVLDTYDPYLYLSKLDRPVIYTTNFFIDYVRELFEMGEIRYAYMHLLKCLIEGRLINRTDHFIIQNTIQKKRLMDFYGVQEDRISIIPTGFDSKIVEDVKNVSIPDQREKIIMFSGRLSRYKGVFELLDAFTEISIDNPKWNLWLVGDGPDRPLIENSVKNKGLSDRVKFLGPQPPSNTIKYTNMCDIFVFPSYIESIPGSLLEAMALEKPVVVTDVGPIGEDIVDRHSGILVPPKDPEKLKEGIIRMIKNEDLRKKFARNGRNKVLELTKENLVKKTIEVYECVVER